VVVLPDVNVLVALAWSLHVHHEAAHTWFAQRFDHRWATCPLTQSGFVRVSSNANVIPAAKSPREALVALEAMLARTGHVFLSDEISIADRQWIAVDKLVGYRQITDAHLLGVALEHGAQVVTLDRAMVNLVPAGFDAARSVAMIL
jgi:toxin-antitoxin system PIN domain toxin